MNKKITSLLAFTAAAFLGAALLSAQTAEKKDQSPAPAKNQKKAPLPGAGSGGTTPHETTSAVIDGNRVTIVYGRPAIKHPRTGQVRTIWGGDLVPAGKPWRTGADEATLLITQRDLEIGGKTVPAGAYTLWTLLQADGSAKLIINKQIGQWGAVPPTGDFKTIYDEANDLARVDLTKEPVDTQVELFKMGVERNPSGGGLIRLSWDMTSYTAAFTVKK